MDINKAFEEVIRYIDKNVCGELDLNRAAQILGTSEFHFQRIFSFLTGGITVAEYIKRRKMALAAMEIKKSDIKIIDLAMKYGYDSPSSFTRAFVRHHGVTPSKAKRGDVEVKNLPLIKFNINVSSNDEIKFRIEHKESFKMFGKNEIILPSQKHMIKDAIINFGNKIIEDGTHDKINIAAGFEPGKNGEYHLLHGIHLKQKDGTVLFMYGWKLPEDGVSPEFTVINIPKATWAVFKYSGKHNEALPKLWVYFYSCWLASCKYEISDDVFIQKEIYADIMRNDFYAEVWVPLKD